MASLYKGYVGPTIKNRGDLIRTLCGHLTPTPKSRGDLIWILCAHLRPPTQRSAVLSFGPNVGTFGPHGPPIRRRHKTSRHPRCCPSKWWWRGITCRHPGKVVPIEMEAAMHTPWWRGITCQHPGELYTPKLWWGRITRRLPSEVWPTKMKGEALTHRLRWDVKPTENNRT